jgi:hypothetical protein
MTEETKDVTITRTETPRTNRDSEGRIIRSKEWLQDRIDYLLIKETSLLGRITNVRAEIEGRKLELETKE